jgi:hypothetical protein
MARRSTSAAAERRRSYGGAAVIPLGQAADDLPGGTRAERIAWLREHCMVRLPWGGEGVIWEDVLTAIRAAGGMLPPPPPEHARKPRRRAPRADW